eukprot:scaffold284051_cov46-Attheya_sp.AAC.2
MQLGIDLAGQCRFDLLHPRELLRTKNVFSHLISGAGVGGASVTFAAAAAYVQGGWVDWAFAL